MSDEPQLSDEPATNEEEREEERQLELPAWVPAAIGLTLVLLAGMAVYTGFRTRVRPPEQSEVVTPFTEADGLYPEETGGPPGAPEPGESRMSPAGDVPAPGPLTGAKEPGLAITGDAEGVSGRISRTVRRGLVFDVEPPDAVIYVNDVAVGSAKQFASHDEAYEFAEEGVFTIRISAPGYEEVELQVSANREAEAEVADVSLRLQEKR